MTDNTLYISCGVLNHCIFIGSRAHPQDHVIATQSAIQAVRDYMVDDIKEGEASVGYSWKRGDGKTVKLVCIMEDADEQ